MQNLSAHRSRGGRSHPQRDAPAGRAARADRLRELRQSEAVLEAAGLGAHQQVRRGLSGQALLRRLRVRRRGRDAGHRARRSSCSAPTTPTCSPTPAPRPTWPSTCAAASPATPSWAWTSPTAATSPTASPLNFSGQVFKVVAYGVRQGRRAHRLRRGRARSRASTSPS